MDKITVFVVSFLLLLGFCFSSSLFAAKLLPEKITKWRPPVAVEGDVIRFTVEPKGSTVFFDKVLKVEKTTSEPVVIRASNVTSHTLLIINKDENNRYNYNDHTLLIPLSVDRVKKLGVKKLVSKSEKSEVRDLGMITLVPKPGKIEVGAKPFFVDNNLGGVQIPVEVYLSRKDSSQYPAPTDKRMPPDESKVKLDNLLVGEYRFALRVNPSVGIEDSREIIVNVGPNQTVNLGVIRLVDNRPCKLNVRSVPVGASIWLDSNLQTALTNTVLSTICSVQRTHTLKFTKDGFMDTAVGSYELNPGDVLEVPTVSLVPAADGNVPRVPNSTTLLINSALVGATVFVDGQNKGMITPAGLNVTLTPIVGETYKIRIEKDSMSKEQDVSLFIDDVGVWTPREVSIDMDPSPLGGGQ